MKILICDDSGVQLDALALLLRDRGHAVETAANGLSALVRLAVRLPDVVVLDLVMPAIDGQELLARLPVVVTTALPDPPPLPPGVVALRKPFDVAELEAALARAVAVEGGMPC
jgi:two-component system, OmpR family, response regulator PrrA